jgi:tripartite-type tricarboxylate transporter receptor subunit TctC
MGMFQKVAVAAAVAASTVIVALPGSVYGQNNNNNDPYPSKPIRIVVPFTPGGTSDVLARTLGAKLSDMWGQPVVIENRTGAGGTIGTGMVAKATPDGYTLLISSAAFVISAAVHENLPYDITRDFSGITRLGFSTTALITSPSTGVRTVKELVDLAKAKPNQLIYSHAGVGSSTFMNGERFKLASGIKAKQVGFKGAADAQLEVVAGRVHFAIVGLASSLPFIKDGRLIALAMGTPQRSSILPDVPTIAETLPGYARDGSHSMVAPRGTPQAVLTKISQDVKRALEIPDVKQRLENIDFVAAPTTPDEHNRIIRADLQTFTGVVQLAGLRPK